MLSRIRTVTFLTTFLLFCYSGVFSLPAVGQKKGADDSPGRLPAEGSDKLDKEYRDKGSGFRALSKGERPATKADLELIDLGAKYYVYRLTWRELANPTKPGSTTRLINEAELIIKEALAAKVRPVEFLNLFGQRLAVRLKELLSHDDHLVRVNAAIMLTLAARTGSMDVADLLAETLRDDRQIEAVRYWALNALRELFAQARQPQQPLRIREEQEIKCITALIDYLQRPPDFPDRIVRLQRAIADEKKPPEEKKPEEKKSEEKKDGVAKDGVANGKKLTEEDRKEVAQYEGGMQLARRAAIRALGETRYPALVKKADGRSVPDEKALTALILARVVTDDIQSLTSADPKKAKGIAPPASLGEQVEASIGLCQLQWDLLSDYCPDYAAHHVGRFLVQLAERATNRNVDGGRDKGEPFKTHAARLQAALGELETDMKKRSPNDPATKYTQLLTAAATKVLRSLEAGTNPDAASFGGWLDANPPPNKSLYKSLDKAVVKPADASSP